ncbi:ATPase [Rugosibacter aromaticivorans]|uniref:ATPase n=1 Tax=Rugosibacter aromaticivorans TaxID=1565605 RepID=A0A0C5JCP3_9PROT|nr:ATP-binding protein [Rugosibacter aromaticivorans]AJP49554.1 ATPase [Rugosibacter aromaticivorans]TBR13260.1 MAG: ATP-binding protein [Rugosibacter sp.]
MIERLLSPLLSDAIAHSPAVALFGPRQVGKTTLALAVGQRYQALYLDLESEQDLAKLAQPALYLADHQDKLIILDEVHRAPGLFPVLRGLIDQARRTGKKAGQYLLLGSASLDLLKQSGETLAGRIAYLELSPFNILETKRIPADDLWVRGGFPESLLAPTAALSLRWRQDFIRTYLERDIPQFGPRIAAETLRRFWGMLAHHQGGVLNTAQFARNLGVDVKTAGSYLALLVDLMLVRRLLPWHANLGKRLVKSPKVYVRDSGLVHALLSIADKETLLAHPVVGQSWECFVIENLLACAADKAQAYFYRTSGGAEIDLLLSWPDGRLWAIEIKRSLSPKVERGFHAACADLAPVKKFVVYPGVERYRLAADIEAVSLYDLANELFFA